MNGSTEHSMVRFPVRFEDIAVGDTLTPVSIEISYKRICMNAGFDMGLVPRSPRPRLRAQPGPAHNLPVQPSSSMASSTAASTNGPDPTRSSGAAESQ